MREITDEIKPAPNWRHAFNGADAIHVKLSLSFSYTGEELKALRIEIYR